MDRRGFIAGTAGLAVLAGTASAARPLRLSALYNPDMSFSDTALDLEGKLVEVDGFMAPPLKADAAFFVLTRRPMSVCPFCESEAEWPSDILAIYTKRQLKIVPYNLRIYAKGVLQLGGKTDAATGFVSRVRLADATYG